MLISAPQHKSNSISNFFEKKIQFLGSHVVASTREDLSFDVSITNVDEAKVISALSQTQNSNFELFLKKFKFSGFHGVVLVKTFPLMHQLLM